ncbi:hypothetical protein P171DRAFT_167749 [Karstenula rhodostoma CBS 690.94]|uniref:Uncharacterized protein n=1 Tax=Karstenula rhodostoma CBS 690.94 TaxID=1392251 RepID=A0A9P4U6G2_9PLEO|nr:hypothetical protein P171DRAFT_167749 [Karstenula rhodostoma CBS 690.94]
MSPVPFPLSRLHQSIAICGANTIPSLLYIFIQALRALTSPGSPSRHSSLVTHHYLHRLMAHLLPRLYWCRCNLLKQALVSYPTDTIEVTTCTKHDRPIIIATAQRNAMLLESNKTKSYLAHVLESLTKCNANTHLPVVLVLACVRQTPRPL